ncbi:LysR family transcriptional regulator [Paraburkholderia sp. Cy-641]|uniref:LysR family transcriptional regulator n=1 Tax=Paraburkholderia sp. Cy-641 TaxID=2608337 RepID=UPI00141FE42C|nr:LysR family transcriptional regulator [Paraburkholderia sp. Cy-641]NIF77303.1 LysR family transcriptional regulator [Paraburkholderia sp. Cy-641]
MDTIQSMRMFVRVVEAGTFTAVAHENDTTTAQISRAVSSLEKQLQATLLRRSTRHLSLTEAGARYYERVKAILADVDLAHAEARSMVTTLSGHLRVHSSPGLAQRFVTASLLAYQADHPDVTVELGVEQDVPNLVEDGYDVSLICASQLADSGYVARILGTTHSVLVASPAYLSAHGEPGEPADLANHTLLRFASPIGPANEWHLENANGAMTVPVNASPFQVNTPDALAHALRMGTGIGALAVYSVFDDLRSGALVRVLPQYRLRPFNVYAIYAPGRYPHAKVRTLIEHLRTTIQEGLTQMQRELDALTDTQDQASPKIAALPATPAPLLRAVARVASA